MALGQRPRRPEFCQGSRSVLVSLGRCSAAAPRPCGQLRRGTLMAYQLGASGGGRENMCADLVASAVSRRREFCDVQPASNDWANAWTS